MRTQGTIGDVYAAAKNFSNGGSDYGGRPMDPVVRHTTDGVWMLESGINSEPNADAECPLEAFDNWFFEAYSDDEYEPTETDEIDFLDTILTREKDVD